MNKNILSNKIYVCGIGAQKSGTTFIANYLSAHPDFYMSPLKELHYFNTQSNPNYNGNFEKKLLLKINESIKEFNNGKSINTTLLIALIKRIEASRKNNYKSYFNYFVQERHIAFGEITPAYSTLTRDEYKKIVDMFSNHKFLFILRNPVDRFWSQINYELKDNINPLSIIDEKLKDKAYILRSEYNRTIEELLSITDMENIFIEFYENIFSNKGNAVIEHLSDFLNIKYHKDLINFSEKINATSYEYTINREVRLKIASNFKEVYKYTIERFEVPNSWKEDYKMIENL